MIMVKIFHLASEHTGCIRLLGTDELAGGQEGFIQLVLDDVLFAEAEDRFILRFPSPSETIGGGQILQVGVHRKHKRTSTEVIARLTALHSGSNDEKLIERMARLECFSAKDIPGMEELGANEVGETLERLVRSGQIIKLTKLETDPLKNIYMESKHYFRIANKIIENLESYHTKFPLRAGSPKTEFRKLKFEEQLLDMVLECMVDQKQINLVNGLYSSTNHLIKLSPHLQNLLNGLEKLIDQAPYSPPDAKQIATFVGSEMYDYLVKTGFFGSCQRRYRLPQERI